MSQSRLWNDLNRQVSKLRSQFLPDPFDSTGSYPELDRVQAHTRAYLVLCHAEVETFLEDWAKEIARAAETVWSGSSRHTAPMVPLVGFVAERLAVPEVVTGSGVKDSSQRLADAIAKLFQSYYKRIKDNHGVKESNIHSLFGPLGVPMSAFGATLLPGLDDLGSRRGDQAHHSVRAVSNVVDPLTEHQRVTRVVGDLASFDTWLLTYRRKIR